MTTYLVITAAVLGMAVVILFLRGYFFEMLAVLLMGGSIVFFRECVEYLGRRDYFAALILMLIGVAVITVAKEMARLALIQKE